MRLISLSIHAVSIKSFRKKADFYIHIFIPTLLISVCGIINAQYPSPSWTWAKAFYGTKLLESPLPGPAVAVDPSNGAVYTTGSYFGTVDFNPGDDGIFNLDSLSLFADMFISKLDANGKFVWAKQISPHAYEFGCRGSAIAVDPSGGGDIYTTGAFHGTVDFDPGPGTFNLTYSGLEPNAADNFVCKLDSAGNFKWAKRMGGTGYTYGRSIAVDPSGNGDVYVLGTFIETTDFNPDGGSLWLNSDGLEDIFISKIDKLGNFQWTKRIGGTGLDIGFSLTLDPMGSGDIYVTGDFTGKVDFDPGVNVYNLNSVGVFDIFILKLNSDGDFKWVRPMFGSHSLGGAGSSIVLDPINGDIYTTGYFAGAVDFDPGKGIFNLYSQGTADDIFISKLDSSGDFVWAKRIGGTGDDESRDIVFDPAADGGVYIMGNFAQKVDFNPGTGIADTFYLDSGERHRYFISKLDRDGNFQWAKSIDALQPDQGASIAFHAGSLYASGIFLNPSISFDSIFLTNEFDTGEYWDVFVAKLNTAITTSVAEITKHPLNIYPNPATNELTIEFEEDEILNIGINMFNVLGEIVYSKHYENFGQSKTIDISALSSGIYFIELNIDGQRVIEKVVKE